METKINEYIITTRLVFFVLGIFFLFQTISLELIKTESMQPYLKAKSIVFGSKLLPVKLFCFLTNKNYELYTMNLIADNELVISYHVEEQNRYRVSAGTSITHQAINKTKIPNLLLTLPRSDYLKYRYYAADIKKITSHIQVLQLINKAEIVKFEQIHSVFLCILTENRLLYTLFEFTTENRKVVTTIFAVISLILLFDYIMNIINNGSKQ